jgi:hypothetical protein
MTMIYRSDKGAPLTVAEMDGNFHDLDDRLSTVETALDEPPAMTFDSDVTGNQWTLTINGNDYVMTIPQASYAPPVASDHSGSTLSLGAVHANAYTRSTNATALAVTVNTNAVAAIPLYSECHFRQAAAGKITFAGASGVTINPQFGCTLVTAGEGATVTLKKVGTNEWDAVGQFEAA